MVRFHPFYFNLSASGLLLFLNDSQSVKTIQVNIFEFERK